jgi:hypothetical protein
MSDLLKNSIADAKAVREAALANAKAFLEEQFNSSLQSMFTKKLSEELNEDDGAMTYDELGDMLDTTSEENPENQENPDTQVPAQPTNPDETDDSMVSDGDIDEILKELAQELDDEETTKTADSAGEPDYHDLDDETLFDRENTSTKNSGSTEEIDVNPEGNAEEVSSDRRYESTGEIDLNELLNELEETSYDTLAEETEGPNSSFETIAESEEDEDEEDEDVSLEEMANALVSINEENKKLKASLKQHIDTIHELKNVLSETNLLNAKLLYTNKLFKGKALTESQKLKVIDTFDLTKSIREVKLAYSVLAESFNFGESVAKPKKTNATAQRITEGLASKPVKSTAPIVEPPVNEMASRFQRLAGIKK